MNALIWLELMLALACVCDCQSSSLVVDVVEIKSGEQGTFICNVSSSTNITRWTYLSKSNGTSLMRFQDGKCMVSPSNSFLNNGTVYSYTCNSTVHQITTQTTAFSYINKNILACRDAVQPDGSGSTWMIKYPQDGLGCSDCESTITFNKIVINETDNAMFVCEVSSDVPYVNWDRNIGSNTSDMGLTNNECTTTTGTTFLDNTNEYIYVCNNTVYQVTRLKVQRSQHNDMYMCYDPSQLAGTGSNWIIKVKAPVTSVEMTPYNYSVTVTENTTTTFTCTTSTARPAATVYWYIHPNGNSNNRIQITNNVTTTTDFNDLSVTTSIIRLFVTRHHNNTKIFCTANNSVDSSPVNSTNKILLNVQYKADGPYVAQGNPYRVIEDSPLTLSCSVKGGNPTPTLSWSCDNVTSTNQSTINSNANITTTFTWTVLRNHTGNCVCTSRQTGFTIEENNISIDVLYPPSKPVLTINGDNVEGNISFIEGTTRSITCTSDSKPSPYSYKWTGPFVAGSVLNQTLIFKNVKRSESEQYTCSVKNAMTSSRGHSVDGINSAVVNITILYPPEVKPMNNVSELSGKQLNWTCDYSAGKPKNTTIKWTRAVDNKEWNTVELNISSLTKDDTGVYTCAASNIMVPSGDNKSYIGQHNQSAYLDVSYKANVTSFTINGDANKTMTVNENGTVRFICDVDSNPTAVTILRDVRKTLVNVTSNHVKYNITKVDCLDAGTYSCSAKNTHNDRDEIFTEVQLFVNCYPRAAGVIDTKVTSEKNKSITIVLNVIAYPQPNFAWYQLVDDNWTILHDDDKYDINSSNTQSNLTVHNVASDDFTSYKVNVENDIGKMKHLFFLSPYDKPDPPTEFRHIESDSTPSSIHLQWTPGFDNGPSQTFYIKFRKSLDTEWKFVNVSDNGEPNMELTLSELTEGTQYYIVIFASNVKGNSSESKVLVAHTQAIDKPPPPGALIGGIAGGVAGCIILVIVIIVIIRRYPVFKRKGANEAGIRRSVSDDSDEDDGLVDNPMYVSSNNVASASAVPSSSGVFTTPPKPKQSSNEDLYTVVNKTKRQDKVQKGKTSTGKNTSKGGM
ncbi:CD80-like C2-set immunoglobulin domain [Mactra antiquata]